MARILTIPDPCAAGNARAVRAAISDGLSRFERRFRPRVLDQEISHRLEGAVDLLTRSELPIVAISARLGHSTPSGFARAFARWTLAERRAQDLPATPAS